MKFETLTNIPIETSWLLLNPFLDQKRLVYHGIMRIFDKKMQKT